MEYVPTFQQTDLTLCFVQLQADRTLINRPIIRPHDDIFYSFEGVNFLSKPGLIYEQLRLLFDPDISQKSLSYRVSFVSQTRNSLVVQMILCSFLLVKTVTVDYKAKHIDCESPKLHTVEELNHWLNCPLSLSVRKDVKS